MGFMVLIWEECLANSLCKTWDVKHKFKKRKWKRY